LSAQELEDFSSHVRVKLLEDEFAILKKYERRCALRTYLAIVVGRLLLDYRNSVWGKWRPSAEARRVGAHAMLLEQLVARDGYTFEEACEIIRTNHRVQIEREELERIATRIPVRVRRRFEPDDVLVTAQAAEPSPEESIQDRERQAEADRVSRALAHVVAKLNTEDRLILSLHFRDGRKISEIASMLRLAQKPLYGRLDRILDRLRDALTAEGFDAAAIAELLK
jgi:RNA polymerase sigma factor for flagellar operon FliA